MVDLILSGRRIFKPYRLRDLKEQHYAVMVAHRRCGKTVACVHPRRHGQATTQPLRHVGPYLGQAKEVAWKYLKRFAEPVTAQ